MKNFLLLLNQQFSFSAENEYKLVAERRAAARREANKSLPNSNWRCILNIARTNFRPRPPAAGSGQAARFRRNLSELPKSRKNIGSNHILLKENFSISYLYFMDSKTRKQIEEYVKSLKWTAEDFYWKHAFQVREFALMIQKRVGGEKDVIEASALLHDIGKAELLARGHEEISAKLAQEFLEKINFDKNKIQQVIKCIKYENFEFIEEKILRSADSMALIMDERGQKWYFENILKNNKEQIIQELQKSYSEIEFDFAKKFVEKTYKQLVET